MRNHVLLTSVIALILHSSSAFATDIQVTSATTSTANMVVVNYTVSGSAIPSGAASLTIYRSADSAFDANSDIQLKSVPIVEGGVGDHQLEIVFNDSELSLTPATPFVFAVADAPTAQQPNGVIVETNEGNNAAYFRKYAVAVVIHGLTFYEAPPAWVDLMSETLLQRHYDVAIKADWAQISSEFRSGAPQEFAVELSAEVHDAIEALPLTANDRVDVHWIGHSRGAVVASETLKIWSDDENLPQAVTSGWMKLTLLDPHPAKNRPQKLMSVNLVNPLGSALALYTVVFQAIASDPDVEIPVALLGETELYYQRAPWYILSPTEVFFDYLTNLWGEAPLSGIPLANTHNITRPRLAHFEVPNYYIDEVLLGEYPGASD